VRDTLRPGDIPDWPQPFDPAAELDWADPVYSRRLLREHLDQAHDGASRRLSAVEAHVARLRRLLPPPPARLLDAACGPGLYAIRLARLGYSVLGVDVGPAVLREARAAARDAGVATSTRFVRADLRRPLPASVLSPPADAAILVYYVLEGFPRAVQPRALRHLAAALRPGGRLLAELRIRPEHPRGRLASWERVPRSLLADRPHLLLCDSSWDDRAGVYVLREVAVLDGGGIAVQQTTSAVTSLDRLPALFARGGLRVRAVHDGWTRFRATALSDSALVVAERPLSGTAPGPGRRSPERPPRTGRRP